MGRTRLKAEWFGALAVVATLIAISLGACGSTLHAHKVITNRPTATTIRATPASTTTTSVTASTAVRPVSSSTAVRAVTTTTAVRPVESTTATTLPVCAQGQIVTVASTDAATYSPGQTAVIGAELDNTGPTCSGADIAVGCGITYEVTNRSGQVVWDSWASSTESLFIPEACPQGPPGPTFAGLYGDVYKTEWNLKECSGVSGDSNENPNPNCPETQVPDGTYYVTAAQSSYPTTGQSSPVAITISG